ncbi:putative CyP450 monooxygenase [Auricularia subglabra TFB-10046 SS5]|nr:putative CyP450 monooxygenase [Auricularia subglabra TFB-10046 SS5]
MAPYAIYALASAALCVVIGFALARRRTSSLPLPPGPPQHPVLGNMKDIPAVNQWEGFTRMGKIYGPVVHLRVLHRRIIVLNSIEAVTELLDRRGSIYSDRPELTMACEVMGWGWQTSLMHYGERWRANRRIVHHFFHEEASKQYHDLQARSNLDFLHALQQTPDGFMQHIRNLTASSIMKLTYDIEVEGGENPWVALADLAVEVLSESVIFGNYMVDWLPILRHIPAWFPGAGFKILGQESREVSRRVRLGPLDWVMQQISQGKNGSSIAEMLIRDGLEGRPVPDDLTADATAIIYMGGTDTTVSVITAFFLCMVLHPEAQQFAQDEIDRVLGHGSLPELADREALPYVTAVLLEVIRLYPVLPLSVGRRVMVDDEYNGMRIPKGATIVPNVWAILRDERDYANPDQFCPERYLRNGVLDLKSAAPDPRGPLFGFGRRKCPGRHFADTAAWLAVATVLACFNITRAKDEHDDEIVPDGELRAGAVTCVRAFPCEIKPRSGDISRIISHAREYLQGSA